MGRLKRKWIVLPYIALLIRNIITSSRILFKSRFIILSLITFLEYYHQSETFLKSD